MAEGMGQVSPPIRIALVGAMAFLALWMVALKPKAAAEDPAPAPPAAAMPAPAAEPTPKKPEPKAVAPAPEPKAKPAAAAPRTMVVALVGDGEDDALARELVGGLTGVRTLIVPIDRIGAHEDLLGQIEIRSTPTILVIGADRRAQRLEGLPDQAQLDQALAAVR
jgi:hypothetical protein